MNYGQGAQFHVPPLSKLNKGILITLAVCFVLQFIAQNFFKVAVPAYFGLTLPGLSNGLIYQIVSYPLVQDGVLSLVFNGLLIWFLGGDLEGYWGRKTYIEFLLTAVLAGALTYLIAGMLFFKASWSVPLIGTYGVCNGLLVAYGIYYGDRYLSFMFIFPIKARYFCLLIAFIEVFMVFSAGSGQAAVGQLGAMAGCYGYIRLKAYLYAKGKVSTGKKKKRANKAGLYLVKGDEDKDKDGGDDGPKYWQ